MFFKVLNFFENEFLKMLWLNNLIGKALSGIGIDINSKFGEGLHFFIYDVTKIIILLCILVFIISYIQSFFPPEKTKRILGKKNGIEGNIIAALLGTVTPFCSCSSIPIFISFINAGLPLGVTFSFLISSPMVDIGSLFLLMSIFGVKIAIIYVLFGLIIAIIGGVLIEKMNLESEIYDFVKERTISSFEEDDINIIDRIKFSIIQVKDTLNKVFIYIIVGVGIGAFIHNFIPSEFVSNLLGSNNPLGVVLATLIGIPMYADIFGCIPIAKELLYKGAQLGVVLSFMMAVTTLSLPSLIMLKKVVKIKLLSIFIIICTIGIILVGYLFNVIQNIII